MTKSKRTGSLRVLVDTGASSNFVRHQSLPLLDFEEVKIPRRRLEVRLATCAVVKTEKRFIVLDLDDKFDMVLGMPWFIRHGPVIDWKKRTIVRFGRCNATESDGPVSVAHAPRLTTLYPVVACRARKLQQLRELLVALVVLVRDQKLVASLQSVEVIAVCQFRELTQTRYQHRKGTPPKGVVATRMRRLRESTLQVVRTVANVQHRISLRAVVQPGCMKRNALKLDLMTRARG
ncbi:reverse transcriptase [Phytophthora palmivora]|uniref:Reverse transcriptase n=1 Tax=Phytophthora palmivora TaxID=4796 RepID=A0A2P4X3V4_9STRA|nr:reverse transcriptase [Phytophthora palmivora]